MALYFYRARDLLTQKRVKGELVGENEGAIRHQLVSRNLYPERIMKKKNESTGFKLGLQRFSLKDLQFFCHQLSTMTLAGMQLNKALLVIIGQMNQKCIKQSIIRIYEEVNAGKMLSESMRIQKIFPKLLVNLVACGENTGHLGEVLHRAAQYYENKMKLRNQVTRALTYPLFVLGMIIIVMGVMMIKVVPAYMSLISETGGEVPLPTQIVINLSHFCTKYYGLILALSGGLIYCIVHLKRYSILRRNVQKVELSIPILNTMIKLSLASYFTSTMALLIQSGIKVIEALELTKDVLDHTVITREIDEIIDDLRQGKRLGKSLQKSRIFPDIMISMISVGEESGNLGEMLEKSGEYFKEEASHKINILLTLIEPIMIVLVALIVGVIMAAMILPTFSAASAAM